MSKVILFQPCKCNGQRLAQGASELLVSRPCRYDPTCRNAPLMNNTAIVPSQRTLSTSRATEKKKTNAPDRPECFLLNSENVVFVL
jgi:hypothetical protein